MKKQLALAALLAALSTGIHAQDSYIGIGLPGIYTLGYAYPMSTSWGLRADYAAGLNISKDGNQDGVNVTGNFKASRFGAFADWYPFSGAFRLVGGLTVNDIKADFNGVGTGTSTVNGKPVNMTGETYNVQVKFPNTTPYLGIGYGHQKSDSKGIGFYADLGVMFGTFSADTSTTLVANGKATQADVDAQTQKIRDSLGSISILPSASLGLLYRY